MLDIVSAPKKGTTICLLFPADRLELGTPADDAAEGETETAKPTKAKSGGRKR